MAGKLGNGGGGRGADDVEARESSGQGETRAGELEAVRAGSGARTSEAGDSSGGSGQLQRRLRSTPADPAAALPAASAVAPAAPAAPVNSGGGGVGGEEGELFFLFKIIFRIFLIDLTHGAQSTSANYATSALMSGSRCQFEHQFVVNFVLVDIATNLLYTCDILQFKRKPAVFRNLSANVMVLC
jgi:hypothetical protein